MNCNYFCKCKNQVDWLTDSFFACICQLEAVNPVYNHFHKPTSHIRSSFRFHQIRMFPCHFSNNNWTGNLVLMMMVTSNKKLLLWFYLMEITDISQNTHSQFNTFVYVTFACQLCRIQKQTTKWQLNELILFRNLTSLDLNLTQ